MKNKGWWLFRHEGHVVCYADGSTRIYPTRALAKEDLKKMNIARGSKITIERVWLYVEKQASGGQG